MPVIFNFDDFIKLSERLDQAPDRVAAALANDLNNSAFAARTAIVAEQIFWWPNARSNSFLSGILHVVTALPSDLEVSIVPREYGGKLALHESGGTITPKNATSIAVPVSDGPKRNAHGIRADQKPLAPGMFKRGNKIFMRVGKGKGSRIKLMYVLKPSVHQPADTHFYETFAEVMHQEMTRNYASSMIEAILHGH